MCVRIIHTAKKLNFFLWSWATSGKWSRGMCPVFASALFKPACPLSEPCRYLQLTYSVELELGFAVFFLDAFHLNLCMYSVCAPETGPKQPRAEMWTIPKRERLIKTWPIEDWSVVSEGTSCLAAKPNTYKVKVWSKALWSEFINRRKRKRDDEIHHNGQNKTLRTEYWYRAQR